LSIVTLIEQKFKILAANNVCVMNHWHELAKSVKIERFKLTNILIV